MSLTPLQKTKELGTDFWNDSCDFIELTEAVRAGATGATSNPVIVHTVVKNRSQELRPLLQKLIRYFPKATEDDLAWKLIDDLGIKAAKILEPVFEATKGKAGYLSMQVNPKYYRNSDLMVEQGLRLSKMAPNIAIKAPCTKEGLVAFKKLSDQGVRINATVSFSVPQAIAAAEVIKNGYVTIMVGRLEDHLQRVATIENLNVDPEVLKWSGVAVFKKAHEIFLKKGYPATLLAAAYRHERHWADLIGDKVLMTMPYAWWTKFNQSETEVKKTISDPVDPKIVDTLLKTFPDFKKAYEPAGLAPDDFVSFGPTIHTLNQFLTGYQDLVGFVRQEMLGLGSI